MTEVFQDWQKNKFIVSTLSTRDFDKHYDSIVVVLTDVEFWNSNYEQLKDWCDDHNCEVVGMTVEVPNHKTLTMFCLRWS